LSCVEILVTLYYSVMRPEDAFVLSKAHGCYGLYAILADLGRLPKERWERFELDGCATRHPEWGIVAGCGSLGHGLPIVVGMAWARKLTGQAGVVYCLVGDGEMQEGSNYEAMQFAVFHKLDNLVLIVDCNGLQAMDATENVLYRMPSENEILDRCLAFGFDAWTRPNGHDPEAIRFDLETMWIMPCNIGCTGNVQQGAFRFAPHHMKTPTHRPKVLIVSTIKGKGVPVMENLAKWHYRCPSTIELEGGEV
jgi:transketolase